MSTRPVLRRGDRGEWVRKLQQSLVAAGVDPGPVDGIFGGSTEQAVRDFQVRSGLEVDGVVGPATWNALGVADSQGAPVLDSGLRSEYEQLWAGVIVRPERQAAVESMVSRIVAARSRYEALQASVGVPWFLIGAIHSLESGLSFDRHLHNGDRLTARTVQVPAGRPVAGNPPFTWEESALDALLMRNLQNWQDWSVAGSLYQLEGYNGFGYRMYHPTVLTPYLWSFTDHYTAGKYVADGRFDPNAVSVQCGAAAILRHMEDQGLITLGE